MPDIPNRPELEAELAKRFSRLSIAQRKELLTLLGDPPNYANVPLAFWDKMTNELRGALVPFLAELFMESAERLVDTLPIGVDWNLINTRASSWAARYGGELIKGITETTRRAVNEAIAAFFETGGMTRADLEARLMRIFGPKRAEMIAITEVTRAAAEGEIQIGSELAKAGILMQAVWNTRNDELVCPICGPLNQQKATEYSGDRKPYWGGLTPPAHPRCRCFIGWELPGG